MKNLRAQVSSLVPVPDLIRDFWGYINKRRKSQLMLLSVLAIASAVLEVLSIGSLLPLLAAMIDPTDLMKYPLVEQTLSTFGIHTEIGLLFILTAVFCALAILSGIVRLIFTVFSARLCHAIGADLAARVYASAIQRPYIEHLNSNSSEVVSAVSVKTEIVVRQFLFPFLTIVSCALLALCIVVLMFLANPKVTVFSTLVFGLLYLMVEFSTRRRLSASSRVVNEETTRIVKKVQEGLRSVKEIILSGKYDTYILDFSRSNSPLQRARADIQIISQTPRYVIETGAFVFFGVLVFFLSGEGLLSAALPSLGVLALSLQRLLPTLQQAYAAWTCIQGAKEAVQSVLTLIAEDPQSTRKVSEPRKFESEVNFKNVSFRYPGQQRDTLVDLSISIKRGERLGIVGVTGSGKSSFLDIFMALLTPTSGNVLVDGAPIDFAFPFSWQQLIAHVPQSIFIADATLTENIALGYGYDEIDQSRIEWCVERACLSDVVRSLPHGYNTILGEHGSSLSGGQLQRIGIARALYRASPIIVLDEATSALDEASESSVMKNIDSLGSDVTIIMVAHKMSALRCCTRIVELKGGRVNRSGAFKDFMSRYLTSES